MTTPFILGREEWLALPDLNLPAIKAKVDTGARTSALHAFRITPFGNANRPMVRFSVHPLPGRGDIGVACEAPVIGRRVVTSSNGERELRLVIATTANMSGRSWPIEVSLTNREHMAYRMLLGRQALQDDMLVQPGASFRLPRLGARSYRGAATQPEAAGRNRGLAIALLTRRPDNASNLLLAEAARARGHRIEFLDRTRISLFIDPGEPAILSTGAALGTIDAVVTRAGARLGSYSLAIQRHLEHQGAVALNPATSLRQLTDTLAVRQQLAAAHLPVAAMAVSPAERAPEAAERLLLADAASFPRGTRIRRSILVGGRTVAVIERLSADTYALDAPAESWSAAAGEDRVTAEVSEQAARVLGLGLVAIDTASLPAGPLLLDIAPSPALALAARLTGIPIAERIVVAIEVAAGSEA